MNKWEVAIDQDLAWREAELASLKRMAITASGNEISYGGALRALWAMLYAHYEGFTKFCWDTALDAIEDDKLKVNELTEVFTILALEKCFKTARGNLSSPALWQFHTQELPAKVGECAEFDEECRLTTECNLWPNIFERETSRLGLTCTQVDVWRSRIKTLVSRRNEIAHGKQMVVRNVDEYSEYEHAALCVMHDLAIAVVELLDSQSYRK